MPSGATVLGGSMGLCRLWFESGEDSLDVRRFAVHESISSLFSVSVWARSPNDDLDLEALIGRGASLTVQSHASLARPTGHRAWTGLCQQIEHVHTESTGLSTYHLRIVPRLWALSQRTNHRVFQHASPKDIVDKILREWHIESEWRIGQHAKLHLRTQYGESDFAFLSRILEEAGISFYFEDHEKEGTKLIFTDAPHAAEARTGGPIDYTDSPTPALESGKGKLIDALMPQAQEHVTGVRVSRQVRPGKVTLRDHDYRRHPETPLLGKSDVVGKGSIEEHLEVYSFSPGSFLVEMEHEAAKEFDKVRGIASGGLGHPALGAPHGLDQALAAGAHILASHPRGHGGALDQAAAAGAHIVASHPRGHEGAPPGSTAVGVTHMFKSEASAGGPSGAASGGDAAAKKSFGDKVLDTAASGAADLVAGAITGALFPGDKKGGEGSGGIAGKIEGMITKGAGKLANQQVTDLVKNSLVGALSEQLGNRAAGLVGGFVGHLAGDLAGTMAQKLASIIASPLHHSSPKPAGDDKGAARSDDKQGQAKAQKQLESVRSGASGVSFDTNAIDLWPGVVFSMSGHSRKALGADKRLLVTDFMVEGTPDSSWSMSAHAAFADSPYRPPMKTPKPQITGVQSAVVVGPKGEEIHTDEHGRVRVQFHWDREGKHDDNSHCWIRVAQGAAGAGFGMVQLPRVGQEVLVGFLEGDPDHPMVMGSVFSNTTPVPHGLPGRKTRTAWKSNSYPGGGGSNEMMMEDQKGEELLYMLAEKHMQQIVKHDRGTIVGGVDSKLVGEKHEVKIAAPLGTPPNEQTHTFMVDKKIVFSTGDASITIEKDTIRLWAKKGINVESEGDHISLETKKGDVKLQGGPNVKINCEKKKKPGDSGYLNKHGRYVVYEDQMKVGGAHNWRNNNPGNLKYGSVAKANGALGKDKDGFAIFPDMASGTAAQEALLKDKYGSMTINDMIPKYAPAFENDVDAYKADVKSKTGLTMDETISSLSNEDFNKLVTAMQQHEGIKSGTTYSASDSNLPPEIAEILGVGCE